MSATFQSIQHPLDAPPPEVDVVDRVAKPRFTMSMESTSASVPEQPFNWALFRARFTYYGWLALLIPPLLLLYGMITAEGIRIKFPVWATPLYKIKGAPLWWETRDFFHRWDAAMPLAFGLLCLVWMFWDRILMLWLSPETFEVRKNQSPEVYKRLVLILGVALIVFDSWMFYSAMTVMGWGGVFSGTSLLATVGYAAALIAVALITINLRMDVKELKEEDNR